MSQEAVQRFLDKVDTEQTFAIQVTTFKCVKDLAQFAREAGFDFDEAEFIEATKTSNEWTDMLVETANTFFEEILHKQ